MRVRIAPSIAGGVVLLLAGCTAVSNPRDGTTVVGPWNGPHASLTLTDSGGTIEYDCAHGGLREPVEPDATGRFAVTGVHVREHGGPSRIGEDPDSAAARYVGQVIGDALTLRVFVGPDSLGPFTLRRDGQPRLFKCL